MILCFDILDVWTALPSRIIRCKNQHELRVIIIGQTSKLPFQNAAQDNNKYGLNEQQNSVKSVGVTEYQCTYSEGDGKGIYKKNGLPFAPQDKK